MTGKTRVYPTEKEVTLRQSVSAARPDRLLQILKTGFKTEATLRLQTDQRYSLMDNPAMSAPVI
ncbi:hypothetical protein RCT21_24265 [Escherichia marmotae]|uniref:hypothetical protein n=1 Tax=Escherichia coli TaxID=562 RepID=UPI001482F591|nr:hypothetical protein [Escherichia coli]MEC9630095.1 hypothetical protein [Escherichia marmotae]EGI9630033.1 hypothetical protein [Escherichia coli]MED0312550.1 hypothetical protein [Escherichia coli]MED0363937.1 hypothetical protein [Escherichia marmotae]MED8775080.1 hypothetical protein [Escherichia marmotae]